MSVRMLVNGVAHSQLDARDRGVQYGDGLFETMAVIDGAVRRFSAHWARLQRGCERLGIPLPDRTLVEAEIAQLALGESRAVLKLILTRGYGGRGYRPPEQPIASRVLWLDSWPQYPQQWAREGVIVRLCDTVLSEQAQLAGLKHLNRLEQVLARREWRSDGGVDDIAEGLMLNSSGDVVCGTMSNVFVVRDGVLLTPQLDRSGVAGTVRAAVLTTAPELGIEARETPLDLEAVRAADELFLTNALIGVWPIRRFEEREYPVGALTRRLQSTIEG